jgi:SAM-dependent methyltransferase
MKLKRRAATWIETRRRKRVTSILSSPSAPRLDRAEKDYARLQNRFGPRPEYGYALPNVFKRACERAAQIVDLPGLGMPGLKGIDLGTGDGMVGVILQSFGHIMTLSDVDDWRVEPAKSLPMIQADYRNPLSIAGGAYDFIVSFNAFEHFPDPSLVMEEMLRILKPGGLIYFNFNPLYCSPWGLHAYRSIRMPYPQYLFSKPFIEEKLKELGVWDLGRKLTDLQYLNGWRPNQFEALWKRPDVQVLSCAWHKDDAQLGLLMEYPECFSGRGLTYEDVVVSGMTVVLRKK